MTDQQKQGNASRGARRRARFREIASVLWEEGLFDPFRGAGLEESLPTGEGPEAALGTRERDLPMATRVRHALERLGPVFIKVGQLLATRSDLVPPALLEELAKLQDDVPAAPWPEMRTQLEAELGAPLELQFESFDETPLAAASIGQVYRATLPGGTPVAVKVQRPGVLEAMDLDLDILHDLAIRLERHVQWGKDIAVSTITEDFAALVRGELDYAQEGRFLDRFRSAFADDPSIVVPQVYWEATTGRVLTMDLIQGVPGTDLNDDEKAAGVDRVTLVQLGVDAYLRMIFQLGSYHADPHAGNIFALSDGRLALVDFGRVATISERNREAGFDMLQAVFDNDPSGVTEALLAMTGVPPRIDMAAFEIDISSMLAKYRHEEGSGKALATLMQGFLKLMRTHHLQVPTELTMLLPTLGVLEGVAFQLDPTFRMIDACKPFARKLMPERYGPERIFRATLRSARAYGRFFDQLPVHATRALRRISEGEFRVAVRPEDYAGLVDRLTAGVYLLAYAVIVGALIVGFGFIMGGQALTQVERIVYRVVLSAAIASVLWLLVRSLRHEWRRRQVDRGRR